MSAIVLSRGSTNSKRSHLPVFAGLLATALGGAVVLVLDQTEIRRHRQEVRGTTLYQLCALRARAGKAINKRLHLTRGLVAAVSSNPNLTEAEFATLASSLEREYAGIRSVALIRDNVVIDVYPRAGHEHAIGLTPLEFPEHRGDVLKAMESGTSSLAGPVQLVEGGEAFVHRAHVSVSAAKPSDAPRYWGMVSVVIDRTTLIDEITRGRPANLEFAIRNPTPRVGAEYLTGDPGIEEWQPLALDVELPTGSWQVAAVPQGGWPTKSPLSATVRLFGGAIAVAIGALAFVMFQSNHHSRLARNAAAAASRAKTEFLSNMSHEIRTPMTAILGYADVILDDSDLSPTPDCVEAVQAIKRSGQHLLDIVNDILDLSQIEAGNVALNPRVISAAAVLDDVHAMMRHRAEERGNQLRFELSGQIPETIESCPQQLKQALVNLVGNAIKFTSNGIIRVICSCDHFAEQLVVQVIDSGIGMTQEQAERIFRRFEQEDSSATRPFSGTGLGLTITHRIAEMLGGNLSVQSEPGLGSTFTFRVATGELDGVAIGSDPSLTPASAPDSVHQSDARIDGRILLVDDAPVIRRMISFFLTKHGADVTFAENGQAGLEAAHAALQQGRPFDLILMDMQMPVMDGCEATRCLRQSGYPGPIVGLTANAMPEQREEFLAAGCDAVLTKPIDRPTLVTEIMRQMRQREPRASSGNPAPVPVTGPQ